MFLPHLLLFKVLYSSLSFYFIERFLYYYSSNFKTLDCRPPFYFLFCLPHSFLLFCDADINHLQYRQVNDIPPHFLFTTIRCSLSSILDVMRWSYNTETVTSLQDSVAETDLFCKHDIHTHTQVVDWNMQTDKVTSNNNQMKYFLIFFFKRKRNWWKESDRGGRGGGREKVRWD